MNRNKVMHRIQKTENKAVSKTQLQKFKRLALEEAKLTIKECPNMLAFFVYGSVARGNPTQSSDIDTITILNDDSAFFFKVAKRDGVLVSKEFHPKIYYENAENLTHRVYDAWIIYDPHGFLSRIQKKLIGHFYTPDAKRKRISALLALADRNLENGRLAMGKDDLAVPLHLRSFSENVGLILHEMVECSPSMRRFVCSMLEISHELNRDDIYLDLVDILGYNDFSCRWMRQAIAGVTGLQKFMDDYPLDNEFANDKGILHPLLAREYTNGTRELLDISKESCLFPCQLYESMVLFRRNPVMKTFFKRLGKNCEMESNRPDYIKNLQSLGFPSPFFEHHAAIFGTEFYGKGELKGRIRIAQNFLKLVKELAERRGDG